MNGLAEAIDAVAAEVTSRWLVILVLLGYVTLIVVKLGPYVIQAYVRERDNRRRYLLEKERLRRELDRRDTRDGEASREREEP